MAKEQKKDLRILRSEKYLQLIASIVVLTIGFAGARALIKSRKSPSKVMVERPAPLVEVARLTAGDIDMQIQGYGSVTPKVEVEISPQVAGMVVWMNPNFRAGGYIEANEPLIKIDPRDYELAARQARATVAEATVALDTEKAEALVAKSEWQQINPGKEPESPLVLRQPQIRRAEASLESAKARLDTAKLNLERTVLSLPITVRIVTAQVDLGQYVGVGRAIGAAYGADVMEIEVPLEDSELAWFNVPGSDTANQDYAHADIIADFAGQSRIWSGKVVRTTGQIDRNSRLVSIIVEVFNSKDRSDSKYALVPGMFVEVQIKGKTLKHAVAVPRDAVRTGNTIWLAENGKLRIHQLDIIRTDKKFAYSVMDTEDEMQIILSSLDAVTNAIPIRTERDLQTDPKPEPNSGEEK